MGKAWAATVLGWWVVVSGGGVMGAARGGSQDKIPPDLGIRTMDEASTRLFADGVHRSDTINRLVLRIAISDVGIYLNASPEPGLWRGGTQFVGYVGDRRYVLVKVNLGLDSRERIAVFAHELQHVCEVADAPDVINNDRMKRLFERIGHRNSNDLHYETLAAQDVERRVRAELRRWVDTAKSVRTEFAWHEPGVSVRTSSAWRRELKERSIPGSRTEATAVAKAGWARQRRASRGELRTQNFELRTGWI